MHCNPLHRIFVTSLVLLSVNAFPLRIFGRQSPHELTAGSSNDDIRCAEARDCAAAEFGIPSNSHYKCNRKGRCTYDCNYNYTSLGGACWLNGTVSTSCNCDPSRSSTSTLLPTPPPPSATDVDDGEDEVEEEFTVTETSLSVVTASSPQTIPPPSTSSPPLPRPTSTRPPRYVTVTELSISTVPYIQPTTSRHRSTRTKTKTVTVTSISISTASPPKSSKTSKSSRTSSPTPLPTNCCSKTSECKQKVPQDAHRICLKGICNWRCNKGYLKKGGNCVPKPSLSTKPALPPCGCVFPSSTSSTRAKSTSTASSKKPQRSPQPTATVTQTVYAEASISTMSSMITMWTTASPTALGSTLTLWTAADATTIWTAPSATTIWTAPSATTIWTAASEKTIWTAASPTPNTPTPTVTVTTRVPFSIAPVRPLPTPRIIYIETCSCDEDCTINVPADASPICDPKMATCTWACDPGFWINSDGSGCLPEGSAFAAFSRQLVVLSPTVTRPHTAFLERPTPSSLSLSASSAMADRGALSTGAFKQLIVEAPLSIGDSSNSTLPRIDNSTSFKSSANPFLLEDFSTNRFFDNFFFADSLDESNTFVNYLEMEEASELNLTTHTDSTVTLSMDRFSNLSDSERRDSVRLSSKQLVQSGSLLVVDLAHVPTGCFVFPSIYLHSANSSEASKMGEVDLFDGSSTRDYNRYSVQSPTNCLLSPSQAISGEVQSTGCAMSEGGCATRDRGGFAGDEMNRKGGGVIALRLAEDGIRVWQWNRSQVPDDLSNSPHPESWGDPTAAWSNDSCDINSSFRDLRLAFDITTCGDWKGKPAIPFAEFGSCAANYATCEAGVQDPANFAEAYFEINSVKVYSL